MSIPHPPSTSGGATGLGTVFPINPVSGVERVLHSFKGGSNGASPGAALSRARMTGMRGAKQRGTVFDMVP